MHHLLPRKRFLKLILIQIPCRVMNPWKKIVILLNLQLFPARNHEVCLKAIREYVYLLLKNGKQWNISKPGQDVFPLDRNQNVILKFGTHATSLHGWREHFCQIDVLFQQGDEIRGRTRCLFMDNNSTHYLCWTVVKYYQLLLLLQVMGQQTMFWTSW